VSGPEEYEEPGVAYLEDGTPVQVFWVTDEMAMFTLDPKSGGGQALLGMPPEEIRAFLETMRAAVRARGRLL
jgi:hypothetical protein